MEVASESTADAGVGVKREYHGGARLAGDRLVDREYVPVEIEELADGSLQGYSATLSLYLRWAGGALAFYDPATGEPIATQASERARADTTEARVRELEERLRSRGG